MAFDAFLKIDSISGESAGGKHQRVDRNRVIRHVRNPARQQCCKCCGRGGAGGDMQKYLEVMMEQVLVSKFHPASWKGSHCVHDPTRQKFKI